MNRRAFFGVTLGAMAAAVMPWRRRRTLPVVGSIDKATFKFWRNQSVHGRGVQPDWKTLPSTYVIGSVESADEPIDYVRAIRESLGRDVR